MKILILSNQTNIISPILDNFSNNNIEVDVVSNLDNAEAFLMYKKYDALFIDFNSFFSSNSLLRFSIKLSFNHYNLVVFGIGYDDKDDELNYFRSYLIHDYIKNDTDPEIIYLRLMNILKLKRSFS